MSLSGLPSLFIALAGYNGTNIKASEKYFVNSNKWVCLPPLNIARQWPGSILLKSKRAFCFSGYQWLHGGGPTIEIESINLKAETEWKTLPFNPKIAKTFQLAAVEVKNKIVLFGGHSSVNSFNTQILSTEGELEHDLSEDPLILGAMCRGSYTVQREKIYAVGSTKVNYMWDYRFRVFDRKKWS